LEARVRSWIAAGVLSFGTILASAQEAGVPQLGLQLILQSDTLSNGLPRGFTVLLLNRSDHDMRVPTPAVNCQGAYTGVMAMSFHFKPLKPTRSNGLGYGCASDKYNWPPVLERVQEWTVLHPGMSLSVRDTPGQMHCECNVPGEYEFWAGYLPPNISPRTKRF
jgi:hypothetical protein